MLTLMAIVSTVVVGIAAQQAILQSFVPGRVGMKPITVALFVVVIVGLLAKHYEIRRVAVICGLVVLGISATALIEYLLGTDVGTGRVFGADLNRIETALPGRMAPPTAIGFLALGIVLILSPVRSRVAARARAAMIALVLFIGLAVLIGFLYGARQFRGMQTATPMALPTALALLAAGLAAAAPKREEDWPWCLWRGRGTTARVSRFLIPTVILFPIGAGVLRLWGEAKGLFGRELGTALMVLFHIVALTTIVLWALSRLHRSEQAQRKHEDMLHRVLATQQTISELEGSRDAVARQAVEALMRASGGEGAALITTDGTGLMYLAAAGIAETLRGSNVDVERSFARASLIDHETIVIDDAGAGCSADDVVRRIGCERTTAVVPSGVSARGSASDAVVVFSRAGATFDEDTVAALRLMSAAVSGALLRAERREQGEAMAAEQSAEIGVLQQRFSAFMKNVPASAYIKDAQGRYLEANEAMAVACDTSLDELLGQTDAEVFPRAVATATRNHERRVLAEQRSLQTDIEIPRDGQSQWWRLISFPINDATRRMLVAGLAFDITVLVEAERKVAELNAGLEETIHERTEELTRANRELEAFSYSVSHDLRSPLRAIEGYTRILEEDYDAVLDAGGKRYLAVVRSETRRMGTLIDDLLAFSQLSRKSLSAVPLDIASLAREVVDALKHDHPDRTVDLQIGDLPLATGDRATIRQVLANLLSNAVKYSLKKPGPVVITITGETRGEENVYTITDRGVGFDMRYLDKLFGVFQRLHSAEDFEGTGVGLAIVERIIARHGGRVWAEGRVGEGASFSFALPATPSQVSETRGMSLRNTA